MPRKSTREKKTPYQIAREAKGYTLEKAADLFRNSGISKERITRIEGGRQKNIPAADVIAMAEVYEAPELCNYFCSNVCKIGIKYVPEIEKKSIAQIVQQLRVSVRLLKKSEDSLDKITVDEIIDDDEIKEFINIQEQAEKMLIAIKELQLWTEVQLQSGKINRDAYEKARKGKK